MTATGLGAALVTGAGQRIGRAIALRLASRGHAVGVHYNESEAEARKVCDEIMTRGGTAVPIGCDLMNSPQLAACIDEVASRLGAPTVLVNNASVFAPDDISGLEEDMLETHLAINLKAPLLLSKAFAKAVPEGRKGCVINILDQRVWKLTPRYFSYTLSKAALWTATQTMAQALAPRIRVNAVGPGPTLRSIHQDADEFEAQQKATPLAEAIAPDDIADAVVFLAEAPAITGQMLAVDSGQHLAWQTPDTAFD